MMLARLAGKSRERIPRIKFQNCLLKAALTPGAAGAFTNLFYQKYIHSGNSLIFGFPGYRTQDLAGKRKSVLIRRDLSFCLCFSDFR